MIAYFFILIQLASFSAMAQVRHIVFDLDKMIIRDVPSANEKLPYVKVGQNIYHILPHAGAVLESIMSDRNSVLHIISEKSPYSIEMILNQIPLATNKQGNVFQMFKSQNVGKILSLYDRDKYGKFDIRKITSDLSNIVVLTTNPDLLIETQKKYAYIFPQYFFYESYEKLKDERKIYVSKPEWGQMQQFVPETKLTWELSYHRLLVAHEMILADTSKSGALSERLKNMNNHPTLLDRGLLWAKSSYQSVIPSWVSADGKVTDCVLLDVRTRWPIKKVPLQACSNQLPTLKYFTDKEICSEFTHDYDLIGNAQGCERPIFEYMTFNSSLNKYQKKMNPRVDAIAKEVTQRNGSFKRAILSNKGIGVIRELSDKRPECGEEVRRIYKNGGSFYSKTVDKEAIAFKTFNFARGDGRQLYHLTKSEGFMNTFAVPENVIKSLNGPVEDLFAYLRTKPAEIFHSHGAYHSNWGRLFYLSVDTESLMIWYSGAYGIKFDINPKARLVSLKRDIFEKAIEEISTRYPGIEKYCGTKLDTYLTDAKGTVDYHALVFLIAEDSGIDAIDYFQKNLWFQFISPKAIIGAKTIGKVGEGVPYNGNASYSPVDKSYLTTPVVSVVSATYGQSDITDEASRRLDGKITIDYKINGLVFGEQIDNKSDLSIIYECLPGGLPAKNTPKKSISLKGHQLHDKNLTLRCKD